MFTHIGCLYRLYVFFRIQIFILYIRNTAFIEVNYLSHDYTVEARNRFKGLDLIDRVPDEIWTEVPDILQELGIKTIPMEKKCKRAKWLSGEGLQIAVKEEK